MLMQSSDMLGLGLNDKVSEPADDVHAVIRNAAVAADSTLCSEVGKSVSLVIVFVCLLC